jgi:hypothetical protein
MLASAAALRRLRTNAIRHGPFRLPRVEVASPRRQLPNPSGPALRRLPVKEHRLDAAYPGSSPLTPSAWPGAERRL